MDPYAFRHLFKFMSLIAQDNMKDDFELEWEIAE